MIGDLKIKQIENTIKFTDYDFRDMFGTKIHIGDVVCFCEDWGQVDSKLNCAIILDIVDEKIDNYYKIKLKILYLSSGACFIRVKHQQLGYSIKPFSSGSDEYQYNNCVVITDSYLKNIKCKTEYDNKLATYYEKLSEYAGDNVPSSFVYMYFLNEHEMQEELNFINDLNWRYYNRDRFNKSDIDYICKFNRFNFTYPEYNPLAISDILKQFKQIVKHNKRQLYILTRWGFKPLSEFQDSDWYNITRYPVKTFDIKFNTKIKTNLDTEIFFHSKVTNDFYYLISGWNSKIPWRHNYKNKHVAWNMNKHNCSKDLLKIFNQAKNVLN